MLYMKISHILIKLVHHHHKYNGPKKKKKDHWTFEENYVMLVVKDQDEQTQFTILKETDNLGRFL